MPPCGEPCSPKHRPGSMASEANPTAAARRTIAAGTIGNFLEWYDFAIYGYFAATIGATFFPREDPVAQVLAAFGIFAMGYLMRPLGGVVIGTIGDRFGRRMALVVSVTAMAVPTFLVGALPGYHTLGVAAPVLLTFLRMIQGLSVGGEGTTSMIFLVEQAPPDRRGLVGALGSIAATGGLLLGSGTGAAFAALLSPEALAAWGWRIPFLLGLGVGIAGWWLRRHVVETAQAPGGSPLAETLRRHGRLVARLAGLVVFNAVGLYLMFLYIVSWLQTVDGIPPARALEINTTSMLVMLPVLLGAGWLSDRIGRRPLLIAATVAAFLGALPLFWLMHHPTPGLALAGQMGFVLTVGTCLGVMPSIMVEATPRPVRCTAIALGYNLTFGILGGLTPLAAAWLIARTDMDVSPAFLVMTAAAISFATLLSFRESYRDSA